MIRIYVSDRSGTERAVDVAPAPGLNLMEAIRDAGFDELTALCGGCCSCATCHVYIDEQALAELSPLSADEDDLLDGSDYRTAKSRLSCQVQLTDALDGLRVTIAPDD